MKPAVVVRALAGTLLLALALAGPAAGQWRPDRGFPVVADARPVPFASERPVPPAPGESGGGDAIAQVSVGILGGGLGFFLGGAVVGAVADDAGCYELDCLRWAFLGAVAGESLGVPAGVHLANGRRGSYAGAAAASTLIGAAGVLALSTGPSDGTLVAVAIGAPLAQLLASMAIEQSTAKEP